MKLLTIDIEAALPEVAPPTIGEQWVLVRLHREPLGILKFRSGGCSSAELAELIRDRFEGGIVRHQAADGLAGGSAASPHTPETTCPHLSHYTRPLVTAAVCTRNGATRLAECLDALVALEYPPSLLDLVVIDNAPTDAATRRLVRDRYPAIRYLVEPRPGLDWARNRSILEARGDIVAFTDDDVSVDPGWVDAIARVFAEEPDVDAVTGLVVPDAIDVESEALFERYGGFARGFERQYFRVDSAAGERAAVRHGGSGRFGTGANMAFRRQVFDRIGLFDPALDVGTPANGGGDLEMFFRVLKHGGTLVYEPRATVRHRHRRAYEELREQLTNNGIGFYAFLSRSASAYPDERDAFLRLGLWWMARWNLWRLARSFVRRDFPRDLVLAELAGSLRGLFAYGRARAQSHAIAASFGPQRPAAADPAGATNATLP